MQLTFVFCCILLAIAQGKSVEATYRRSLLQPTVFSAAEAASGGRRASTRTRTNSPGSFGRIREAMVPVISDGLVRILAGENVEAVADASGEAYAKLVAEDYTNKRGKRVTASDTVRSPTAVATSSATSTASSAVAASSATSTASDAARSSTVARSSATASASPPPNDCPGQNRPSSDAAIYAELLIEILADALVWEEGTDTASIAQIVTRQTTSAFATASGTGCSANGVSVIAQQRLASSLTPSYGDVFSQGFATIRPANLRAPIVPCQGGAFFRCCYETNNYSICKCNSGCKGFLEHRDVKVVHIISGADSGKRCEC